MKKLFDGIVWVLLLAIALSSCSSVDSNIVARGVDNQGHWITTPGASANIQVFDSLYKVKPNFSEKYELAKHLHTVWMCYTLIILGAAFIAFASYKMSQSTGSVGYAIVIMVGILIIGGGLGSIGWSSSKEKDIPKTVYEQEMTQYGNLNHWWIDEGNLFK